MSGFNMILIPHREIIIIAVFGNLFSTTLVVPISNRDEKSMENVEGNLKI